MGDNGELPFAYLSWVDDPFVDCGQPSWVGHGHFLLGNPTDHCRGVGPNLSTDLWPFCSPQRRSRANPVVRSAVHSPISVTPEQPPTAGAEPRFNMHSSGNRWRSAVDSFRSAQKSVAVRVRPKAQVTRADGAAVASVGPICRGGSSSS
jgi:hypothetical protein